MADVTPAQRDAQARLVDLLNQFDLGSLAGKVMDYLQQGLTQDGILLELQKTQEWKTRFAANEVRRKKGMTVLSPAEYLATERSYRQILSASGVPSGFYDQPTDFQKFLENDVSPAEVQDRVKTAADFVNSASPQQLAYMRQWYTTGDLIAYALDSKRAAPLVGKSFQAASTAGIAAQDGLQIGQQTAEQLAAAGVSDQQARQGFGQLGQDKQTIDLLASIDQQQPLTADRLAQGTFLGDAAVQEQVNKLKSQERARFAGSSGIGKDSLGSGKTGL